MLEPKIVSYSDLYLDPNNPRLSQNFSGEERVSDEAVADCQEELIRLFGKPGVEQKSEFTDIKDLQNSMRQIGFVGIQNIIARELQGNKFLIIEGNRRVATIITLLREHDDALPGAPQRLDEEKLASLQKIQVMVLQTEGLSEEEIEEKIKITLGLRHIGGQLQWDPLPKGYNIYTEYMKLMPEGESFVWESATHGAKIADILAISRQQVRYYLQGYLAYTQIGKINSSVQPHHFSLILACATNKHLKGHGFITMEDSTFALEGDSANKLTQICEFEDRDKRDGKDNILRDPKAVNRLGSILKDSKYHESRGVMDVAAGLFQEVLDKEKTLEDAYTELVAFKKNHYWVQSLEKLLKKKETDLSPEKFLNAGQELQLKAELERLVKKFRALMEI